MKSLFFVLCLLNLVFLLWQFHTGKLSPAEPQAHHYNVSLLTVEEYDRAQRGAKISAVIEDESAHWQQIEVENMLADLRSPQWLLQPVKAKQTAKPRPVIKETETDKPAQQVIVRKCFEAGPFVDEVSAKKWLAQKSLTSKQIVQRDKVIASDFQVYYPAAKTTEQSLANKMRLKDKGLQDIWMIPEGDKKGAYSLGVFNEKSRAVVFKTQLAARDIGSEIWQRDKTQPQWFAKVMLDKSTLKQYESLATPLSACSRD